MAQPTCQAERSDAQHGAAPRPHDVVYQAVLLGLRGVEVAVAGEVLGHLHSVAQRDTARHSGFRRYACRRHNTASRRRPEPQTPHIRHTPLALSLAQRLPTSPKGSRGQQSPGCCHPPPNPAPPAAAHLVKGLPRGLRQNVIHVVPDAQQLPSLAVDVGGLRGAGRAGWGQGWGAGNAEGWTSTRGGCGSRDGGPDTGRWLRAGATGGWPGAGR